MLTYEPDPDKIPEELLEPQEKKDSIYGINISILWFWDSPGNIEPVGLKLNAAYLDGSVDRYKIEDAVYGMGRNGSKFYFSRRWK